MRLTDQQIATIRCLAKEVGGERCRVRLFGSRLNDEARGGDVDLLLECQDALDKPAWVAARLSALVSRALDGRKVDVVLSAPNLMRASIHDMALDQGVLL